jgi:hypothetical protein
MVDHDHAPDCDCGTTEASRRGFMAGCGATLALALASRSPERELERPQRRKTAHSQSGRF